MALVPEFISILRKIRDVIYPEINELYDNSVILKEQIDVGLVSFNEDFTQFETDYNAFNVSKNQVDSAVTQASAYANQASQSATIATNKSNEIKAITAQSQTGAPGTLASASYNPTDGKFTFIIPQGAKGDKGESFTVNSSGTTAQRALYDAQPAGWSFLDLNTSTLYFKVSNTSGDWSIGVPFGKGDTGDTGATGTGIQSFTFISTTDASGLPAQNGATDTYRVTLTDASTFDYQVYNGLDASLTYVDEQVSLVQADVDNLITDFTNHIPMANYVPYNLLEGNLSVDNYVTQKAVDTFLYTGNTTTLPTINLGMDLESLWGDNVNETYGYIIEFKPTSAVGGWTKCNSINGRTKYLDSSSTAVEGTDTNLFTLSTVDGNTTLNIGTSSRVNTNGVTYMVTVWQLTHRKTSVTSQGKTQVEHYNPTTLETVIKYEGSGLAGHEVYHSLGRKFGFVTIKNSSVVSNWHNEYNGLNGYLKLNLTDALVSTSGVEYPSDNMLSLNTYAGINTLSNQYILYGQANAYIDESGKLIGNCEIGVYGGTANTGGVLNKIPTKGMPYRLEVKRLDLADNWQIFDNKRTNDGYPLSLNLTNVEYTTYNYIDFVSDGFTIPVTYNQVNASGGQYLYKVYYDTNSNGGGGYYSKATDNANVQINNAIIPLAKGFDSNGVKNEIVIANETITGVIWEEVKNYPYRTTTGYGKSIHRPRYLKSELIRTYAGESPDYFDVEKNKWFSCDAGSELVVNGTFDTNTSGWSSFSQNGSTYVLDNSVLTWVNGVAVLTNAVGKDYTTLEQSFPTIIGKKYKFIFTIAQNSANIRCMIATSSILGVGGGDNAIIDNTETTVGTYTYEFIAQSNTSYVRLNSQTTTDGHTFKFDNISVFPVEIIPTTEIPESRNYMNHIVHADSQGNPLFVEELQKIKYENTMAVDDLKVSSGFDLGQTWQDVTASRSANVIYTNTTGKPIMIAMRRQSIISNVEQYLYVDGVAVASAYTSNGYSQPHTLVAIVPNKSTYSTNYMGAWWSELREKGLKDELL